MKKQINYYRVLLNILFFILYTLLISVLFSFLFPVILIFLWKSILDPNDPLFANIQILIIFIVLIFTSTLRKYFYLPIMDYENNYFKKENKEEINKKLNNDIAYNKNNLSNINEKQEKSNDLRVIELKFDEKSMNDNELDIKIWKEIK